jgi:hypothetical protein
MTKNLIKGKYLIEDEVGILRKAISALYDNKPLPEEFVVWNNFVKI